MAMASSLPPAVQKTLHELVEHRLATSALLLLAGHHPLAFATGQVLGLAAPVASLLGAAAVGEWAQVLSAREGPADVQRFLATHDESEAE
jgi:hypothetical protein